MSKCPMCSSAIKVQTEDFNSSKYDTSGNPIVIPIKVNYCTNSNCEHTWISHHEEMRVDKAVKSAARYRLQQKEIEDIRKSLNFPTRAEAAQFLNLNEKAFTKWEKGYFPLSDAYDLLLRLAVYSKSNYEFIHQLQTKQFEFEIEDYELLCEKHGKTWRYAQPNINISLNLTQDRHEKRRVTYFTTQNSVANTSFAPIYSLTSDPKVA